MSIDSWVGRHFEGIGPVDSPTPDIVSALGRSQPSYKDLLMAPETMAFVLRGLVADILVQAFSSGQLLGNEAYWELKQAIGIKGEGFSP